MTNATRDFAAELHAAAKAGDWDAHARIWEERRVASVEADEASVATTNAATTPITRITEACGSVWDAAPTEVTGTHPERAFWVRFTSGPRSVAKPGVLGFYAPSIEAAADALNN